MHLYRHVSIIIESKSSSNVIHLIDKEITLSPFHPTSCSELALFSFFLVSQKLRNYIQLLSHFERDKYEEH